MPLFTVVIFSFYLATFYVAVIIEIFLGEGRPFKVMELKRFLTALLLFVRLIVRRPLILRFTYLLVLLYCFFILFKPSFELLALLDLLYQSIILKIMIELLLFLLMTYCRSS